MRRLLKRACVLVMAVLLVGQVLVPPTPVQAGTTFTVKYKGDEFGTNPNNCSLREAIHSANRDIAFDGCPKGNGADLIVLESGDYELKIRDGSTEYSRSDLDIYTSMTITGAGAKSTTVMGVALADRIFHIYKDPAYSVPTVSISNLKISGGVVSSVASGGGGILVEAGTLYLSWAEIKSNSAPQGGGVMVFRDAALFKASSVVFRSNQATGDTGAGGGIYNESNMILENSLLTGNSAPASGGGIDNRPNQAAKSGLVRNTTIAFNTSNGGAGIAASGPGELKLYSSTVARNTGNGLVANNGSFIKIGMTILALNETPNCRKTNISSVAQLTSEGFNLIKDDRNTGTTAQCLFDENPEFPDLEGASIDPLLSENLVPALTSQTFMQWFDFYAGVSPVIDAVGPTYPDCPARDQLFHLRPANDLCDIGAIEYGAEAGLKPMYITFLTR